ncbi:MAG: Fic family protein [Thermales bacterium]|nr:Fic family protein [Thermales bacterium]
MANVFKGDSSIIGLRDRYYKASVGKESLINMISEAEVSEQVYNSNAIENSTLSLDETDRILLELDLQRFVSQREQFEAINLAKIVGYIKQKAPQTQISFDIILALHKILLTNINDGVAGRFRKENEWVRVGSHIAVNPLEIEDRLNAILLAYKANISDSIVEKIAKFHLGFEYIHPFVDGNGRIGRVLNNYLLIQDGFVPINIKFRDRGEYYEAFREFEDTKKTKTMERLVSLSLTNSYHKRLAYLENKSIIDLKEYARINKTSLSNIINKANRQTIEAFTEKGEWRIGV